jgi:hypothetical protein
MRLSLRWLQPRGTSVRRCDPGSVVLALTPLLRADAALEELRSRGHLAASKKVWRYCCLKPSRPGLTHAAPQAARVAAEGLIGVASSATAAVLVELNCETDFVARNPKFQASARAGPRAYHSPLTLPTTGADRWCRCFCSESRLRVVAAEVRASVCFRAAVC